MLPKIIDGRNIKKLWNDLAALSDTIAHWDAVYKDKSHWMHTPVILEVPMGELARGGLQTLALIGRKRAEDLEIVEITGKERFNAQGLEGKVLLPMKLYEAAQKADILPPHRWRIVIKSSRGMSGLGESSGGKIDVLNDAINLSSGTLSYLIGSKKIADIDFVQNSFVQYVQERISRRKWQNWQTAWDSFVKDGYLKKFTVVINVREPEEKVVYEGYCGMTAREVFNNYYHNPKAPGETIMYWGDKLFDTNVKGNY